MKRGYTLRSGFQHFLGKKRQSLQDPFTNRLRSRKEVSKILLMDQSRNNTKMSMEFKNVSDLFLFRLKFLFFDKIENYLYVLVSINENF